MPAPKSSFRMPSAGGWEKRAKDLRHILKMGGDASDCALGSHGLMRRAFQSPFTMLISVRLLQAADSRNKPLMRQTCRMALCSSATALLSAGARLGATSRGERGIMGAIIHASGEIRHICKQGIPLWLEAMEVPAGWGIAKRANSRKPVP